MAVNQPPSGVINTQLDVPADVNQVVTTLSKQDPSWPTQLFILLVILLIAALTLVGYLVIQAVSYNNKVALEALPPIGTFFAGLLIKSPMGKYV